MSGDWPARLLRRAYAPGGAMGTEAELITTPRPARSVRAALKSEPGPPMTLGNAVMVELRLIV